MNNKAVLFDMDGVIALTEYIKARAHVATIEQLGGRASPDLYLRMIGQSHAAIRSAYLKTSGVEADPAVYSKTFRPIYNQLIADELEIRPGAKELVTELRARGYLLGIVSSSSTSSIVKILTAGGLIDDFQTSISADDVSKTKPDPEPYLLALKRLEAPCHQSLAFEDSSTGIESARGAGIRVIGVRHEHNLTQDFSGAIAVLDSFLNTGSILELIDSTLGEST